MARKHYLITTLINDLDYGVSIKRTQIVAQALSPSGEMYKMISSTCNLISLSTQFASPLNSFIGGKIDQSSESFFDNDTHCYRN